MNGKTKVKIQEKAEILEAAQALDSALAKYEALVAEAEKMPLHTRKNIERAARITQDAAQIGEQMGQLVGGLGAAIQIMNTRQTERSEALLARSHEIKRRYDEMVALSDRFEALAAESTKINEDVQSHAQKDLATDEAKSEFLRDLAERMQPLIGSAKELATAAREATFPELEKSADSLAQTLASAKNKVELAAKRLV